MKMNAGTCALHHGRQRGCQAPAGAQCSACGTHSVAGGHARGYAQAAVEVAGTDPRASCCSACQPQTSCLLCAGSGARLVRCVRCVRCGLLPMGRPELRQGLQRSRRSVGPLHRHQVASGTYQSLQRGER